MAEFEHGKDLEKASEECIKQNTKPCPRCHTAIERNGGCNHMICRLCGQHFCYVCGDDWKKHGNEFYTCRFAPHAAQTSASQPEAQWSETCIGQSFGMLRDLSRLLEVARRVDELSSYFDLGLESGFAVHCAETIADARRILSSCYAAKFYLRGRWCQSLQDWTGALESLTETLEVAVLSSALQALPRSMQAKASAEQVWKGCNASNVVRDVQALASNIESVRELRNVVTVHAERMKFYGACSFRKHIELEEKKPSALPNPNINAERQNNQAGCSIL
jgi:hypothetical protein